jgi:hypothetical protein
VPRSWDQRNAINLGLSYAHGAWSATLTDSYHSGWPTTQLQFDPTGAVVIGTRNEQRLGDYNSLDFRVTRTFALSHGVLDVFVEASNALSKSNQCCVQYEVERAPDGTPVLERNVNSWLPLVPSAGVLWRY